MRSVNSVSEHNWGGGGHSNCVNVIWVTFTMFAYVKQPQIILFIVILLHISSYSHTSTEVTCIAILVFAKSKNMLDPIN